MGALAVTDIALFREAYAPAGARWAPRCPAPTRAAPRPARSPPTWRAARAAALEAWLAEHHAEIAALIVEPLVQCAAGMAMHDPEYLRLARALCDRYEVHLVVDEIAVGFGRTGTMFAHQQAGIRPDFICLSKGLTGGTLPLSAVLTTDAVYDAFYDDDVARGFLHSHSYTGNPLACRAALATLEIFDQRDWLAHNRATAARLDDAVRAPRAPSARAPSRQLGMIWAFDMDADDPDFSRRYHAAALARGLMLRPIGNTLYFMPPYVLDDEAVQRLATRRARRAERHAATRRTA